MATTIYKKEIAQLQKYIQLIDSSPTENEKIPHVISFLQYVLTTKHILTKQQIADAIINNLRNFSKNSDLMNNPDYISIIIKMAEKLKKDVNKDITKEPFYIEAITHIPLPMSKANNKTSNSINTIQTQASTNNPRQPNIPMQQPVEPTFIQQITLPTQPSDQRLPINLQASIDLSSYGIYHTLTPTSDLESLKYDIIHKAKFQKSSDIITMKSGTYTIQDELGSGTYGTTYSVTSQRDAKVYAIKTIKIKYEEDVINNIKEFIIQLLLAEASVHEKNGPYVPYAYEIGFDSEKDYMIIRTEIMRNTLGNFITNMEVEETIDFVSNAFIQLSIIMEFLQKKLQFNHRDMKPDNIMYTRKVVETGDEVRLFRIIDFGFSCITWNGLQIAGTSYFEHHRPCNRPYRDLASLLFYMYTYYKMYLDPDLRKAINECLIRIKASDPTQKIVRVTDNIDRWKNSYNYLNRDNINVPDAYPRKVYDTFTELREKYGLYKLSYLKFPDIQIAGQRSRSRTRRHTATRRKTTRSNATRHKQKTRTKKH